MSATSAKAGVPNGSGIRPIAKLLPLVIWKDVVIVVDDGSAKADVYTAIAQRTLKLAQAYPGGIGFVTIVPTSGSPPPDDVRQAIKKAYEAITPHLRCLCWFVDGKGFRAATVRAALAGLRLFLRPKYPTHITDDLEEGMRWVLDELGPSRGAELSQVMIAIRRESAMLAHRAAEK